MRARWSATTVGITGGLALLLGACSGGDQATEGVAETAADEVGEQGQDAARPGDGDMSLEADGSEGEGAAGDAVGIQAASLDRKIIRTARIGLALDDPDAAVDEITALTEDAGGFVAAADLRRGDDDLLRGSMTLRVPATDLSGVLDALTRLADEVTDRSLGSQDVTDEYADIDAQLRNLRALEAQLLDLLAEVREDGADAQGLLAVFDELRGVREEIERLQGRRQVLDDRIDLATVEVRLTPSVEAAPLALDRWAPLAVVRAALGTTAGALQAVANGVIWLALTVVPVLLVTAGPLALAAVAVRRRQRRRAAATG